MENDFSHYSAGCFRDSTPPCTCACPFGLDVRALIEKMQRGNFAAAYRAYRNQVLFPDIVSRLCPKPCAAACVRKSHDESVKLHLLEMACVNFCKDRAPFAFNAPAKPHTVAVIGAGLGGLSCALKLASRSYRVHLYDSAAMPGGRLWGVLDPQIFLAEFDLQFSSVDLERHYGYPVTSLDEFNADAIFIATGENGHDFGLRLLPNGHSLGTTRRGVFMGGGIVGVDSMQAIAHGIRASHSIEAYLKVGSMGGVAATFAKSEVNPTFYQLPVPVQQSSMDEKDVASKEKVDEESARCLRCNCSLCMDNCEMMQYFRAYPPKITAGITSSLNAIERLTERVAQRLLNSCTQCGVCARVCPKKVDMESCILAARRALHKGNALPPVFHDFWLRDMEHAEGQARYLYIPEGTQRCRWMFFPGCQLGASDPAYVLQTYAHIRSVCPDTALLLSCCGVPADWAGMESRRDEVINGLRKDWEQTGRPTLLLGCPTCCKTLANYFPEAQQQSLFCFLEEYPPETMPQRVGERAHIFSPCSSEGYPEMLSCVRKLAILAGIQCEEESGTEARCCGFGGQIRTANPSLAESIAKKRSEDSSLEFITYCSNCRDIFVSSSKPTRHILDVLFTGNSSLRPPPSLSQRRRNRLLVKAAYAGGEAVSHAETEEYAMNLVISLELNRKMDMELILEEEVRQTIAYCERTGRKVLDPETKEICGHLKIGIITYWVSYTCHEGCYVLWNVYSHRMGIEE